MTFSIVGHCAKTGMLGVAITTSSIAVGSRCPWVRAGVGAVATQNVTKPSLGPDTLDLMADGASAQDALNNAMATEPHPSYRQVIVIDAKGQVAEFSGTSTLGNHGVAQGKGCISAGNLLRTSALPKTVVDVFERHEGTHLAERLLLALEAGLYEAGGEEGSVQSACLLVADKLRWPLVDLRVDLDEHDPIKTLRALWADYEPQMNDYVTRAVNPSDAPSYGVPGNE